MEHRFEAHGLDFLVYGNGFMGAEARPDFDMICERVEKALDGMSPDEVAWMHAGSIKATDGLEALILDGICGRIKSEVTKGWHNPNGAMTTLIGIPTGIPVSAEIEA